MIKPERDIETAEDFSEQASEMFDNFLSDFTPRGLTRPVTEEDCIGEEADFLYNKKGQALIDRYLRRMIAVGEKHFPDEDIWIESPLYNEY